MPKFIFNTFSSFYWPYIDYDIDTDDPLEYWRLTYVIDAKKWYGVCSRAKFNGDAFEEQREATPEEVSKMLESMPVNQLPVEVFI